MDPTPGSVSPRDRAHPVHRPAALETHRWLGVLYLTAGMFGAGSVLVPPIAIRDLTTLVVSLPAIVLGIALLCRRRPLDERLVNLLLLVATFALSVGLLVDGDPVVAAGGGVLFVWIAWTAGALSTRRQLAVQLVACAIGSSLAVLGTGASTPIAVIVIITGTSTSIGIAHRRIMEQLRESEAVLAHAATHDALTLLPNRNVMMDRMSAALADHADGTGVLYVDLDHFKAVNDNFGHDKGDAALKEAARRMRSCLRQRDTLARVGGDEFVIVLDGDAEEASASIASRVLEALRAPFDLGDGETVQLSASIGVGLAEPGASPEDLLRHADLAGLSAKREGRDRAVAYVGASAPSFSG
jgi:diguanylate cyclase (GGDEF)-like protein